MLALIRILFGFIVACLVAGLVQVLFVITPAEIAGGPDGLEKLQNAGVLSLLAATQIGVFSSPFALVVAALGEWKSLRSWWLYGIGGAVIALAGFLAQHAGAAADATIVNDYALRAFLAAGFLGGLGYWLISGRYAGHGKPIAQGN